MMKNQWMRLFKEEMAYIHPFKTKRKLLKQFKIIVFKQKKILQNAKRKPHGCATPLSD